MPRPRRCRWIRFEPRCLSFGPEKRMVDLEDAILTKEQKVIILTKDELEAIRLHDLEGIEQKKAAKKMKISQPTFHRTLVEARKKIADALVNGKSIRIEGGNIKMLQDTSFGRGQGGAGRGRGMGRMGNPPTECVCPKCGYKEPKVRGIRCINKKCPKCGTMLVGGN